MLADDDRQQAIEAAVASFKRVMPVKFANGTFERETLDGWYNMISETIPDHVALAIRAALPFPATITAAKAELDYWRHRNDELEAMYDGMLGDTQLSLACDAREEMVRDAVRTGIRARSLEEIELRQRYLIDGQCADEEIEQAVLLDLQSLIARKNARHTYRTERQGASAVSDLFDAVNHA